MRPGAKTPTPLSSEQTGTRRATSPEWEAAAHAALAETSASMPAPDTSGINAQHIQADVLLSPASEGSSVHAASKVLEDSGHGQTLYIAALENRVICSCLSPHVHSHELVLSLHSAAS